LFTNYNSLKPFIKCKREAFDTKLNTIAD